MIPSGHTFNARVLPIPYRPIRFVDKGAVGEVWKAFGPGDLAVAVKIVDLYGREGIKEFEGLQRIKNIRHPNLVPIIGYWLIEGGQIVEPISSGLSGAAMGSQPVSPSSSDAGDSQAVASGPATLVIAMGWGEKSLFSRLKECLKECGTEGIPWEELLGYMDDAAKGIDYLNAGPPEPGVPGPGTPIIHGDIKPQNMLIVGDGVQVCDFGLARAVAAARKTTTGMGTVAYAAPELLHGKPHRTSDQYCLAISYVELRTGRLPFEEDLTPSEVLLRHERGELDLSRLAPGEREVIRQATCPDPDQRWHLCRHLVKALRRACEAEAAAAEGQPAQREPAKALEPSREPAEDTGPVGRTLVVDQPPGAELTLTPSLRQVAETVRLHPKPSEPTPPPRPRRGRWLAVLLLLLIAAGGGVMAYPPARHLVINLFKREPQEPPKPPDERGDVKNDITPPMDPVKAIRALIKAGKFAEAARNLKPELSKKDYDELLKELDEAWLGRIAELKNQSKHGEAIRVFEEAAWKCIDSEDEGTKQLAQLVALWSRRIEELGKGGQFKEALEELSAVPDGSEAAKEKKRLLQELRGEWQTQFVGSLKDAIAKGDFKPARDRLENAPGEIVDKKDKKLLESLYADLVKAEVGYLVGQNKAEAFEKAAKAIEKVLETRDHGPLEIGAEAKKAMREEVRKPWIGQLERDSTSKPDPQVVVNVRNTCEKIQKHFPESPEAALFRARALVHQGNFTDAIKDLEKSSGLKEPYDFLRRRLKSIAEYRLNLPRSGWKEELAKVSSLTVTSTPDPLQTDEWERPLIERIKREIEKKIADEQAGTKPAQFRNLLDLVKKHVRDVKNAKDADFAAATDALQKARKLATEPAEISECEFWRAVIDLGNPQASPDPVAIALDMAGKFLTPGTPFKPGFDEIQTLCDALGQMHLKQSSDEKTLTGQLDRAITLVADTCKRPANANLAVPLGKLWERRIAISVKYEVPGKDEFDRFESHWKLWQGAPPAEKPKVDEVLIDLWQGECLLTCKRPREAQQKLAPHFDDKKKLSAEWVPYAHYVWAWTLSDTTGWQGVLDRLNQAFPEGAEPPAILMVQARLSNAAKLAVEASASLRPTGQPTALTPNPFGDPDKAKQHYYRLLKLAYDNLPKGEHPQALKIGLALAAWYKPDPRNSSLAQQLTADLVKLEDLKLGSDAAPVLYVYLRSHLEPPDPKKGPDILDACVRLFRKFVPPSSKLTPEEAAILYEKILKPAETLTAKMKEDVKNLTRLENFYAAAGELIWSHRALKWSEKVDSLTKAEQLFDSAIEYHQRRDQTGQPSAKLAEYYTRRGECRMKRRPLRIKEITDDAELAVKNDDGSYRAQGLLAGVLFHRGACEVARDKMLADFGRSIDNYNKAVNNPRCTLWEKAEYLLGLSSAHVYRGNYSSVNRAEDLRLAVEKAREANGLVGQTDDPAYLALGNAYEDIAWLGETDPEKNYQEAIRAFELAVEKATDKAAAHCSLGRCYYKALAMTCVDPTRLKGMRDKWQVINAAKGNLEKARYILKEVTREDPTLVDVFRWLGRVYQYLGNLYWNLKDQKEAEKYYGEADDCYKKAKDSAVKQELPERAQEVATWAAFPLDNEMMPKEKRSAEARKRAEQLTKDLPVSPGQVLDPAKEKAWIEAKAYELEDPTDESKQQKGIYDDALKGVPESDPTATKLWLARAGYHLKLVNRKYLSDPEAAINAAQDAVKDAEEALKAPPLIDPPITAHYQAAQGYYWKYYLEEKQKRQKMQDWHSGKGHIEQAIALTPERLPSQRFQCVCWGLYFYGLRTKEEFLGGEGLEAYRQFIEWQNEFVRLGKIVPQPKDELIRKRLENGVSDLKGLLDDAIKCCADCDETMRKKWGSTAKVWEQMRSQLPTPKADEQPSRD